MFKTEEKKKEGKERKNYWGEGGKRRQLARRFKITLQLCKVYKRGGRDVGHFHFITEVWREFSVETSVLLCAGGIWHLLHCIKQDCRRKWALITWVLKCQEKRNTNSLVNHPQWNIFPADLATQKENKTKRKHCHESMFDEWSGLFFLVSEVFLCFLWEGAAAPTVQAQQAPRTIISHSWGE